MNPYLITLCQQLTPLTFLMLGSYDKQYSNKENYIAFKIKGSKKINFIKIKYIAGLDLYSMYFSKWDFKKFEKKFEIEFTEVYFNQLHEIIERETGLYCKNLVVST